MTVEECKREIAILSQKREDKRYAWLRHLLLLAAGSLSVLVSLRSGDHLSGFPHYCIATALAALGLGILFGAVALYGEIRGAHGLAVSYVEEALRRLREPGTPDRPVGFQLPPFYVRCEQGCYLSLVVAVLSLIVYAIVSS
jgi:hypothetical protein